MAFAVRCFTLHQICEALKELLGILLSIEQEAFLGATELGYV